MYTSCHLVVCLNSAACARRIAVARIELCCGWGGFAVCSQAASAADAAVVVECCSCVHTRSERARDRRWSLMVRSSFGVRASVSDLLRVYRRTCNSGTCNSSFISFIACARLASSSFRRVCICRPFDETSVCVTHGNVCMHQGRKSHPVDVKHHLHIPSLSLSPFHWFLVLVRASNWRNIVEIECVVLSTSHRTNDAV